MSDIMARKFNIAEFFNTEDLRFGSIKVSAVNADVATGWFQWSPLPDGSVMPRAGGFLGAINDEAQFTMALHKVLDGAESIGDADDLSAEGYMSVLGAAMRHPMMRIMPPLMVGRAAVQTARMHNVMRVGTERQAREMLRPNVFMTFEFNHTIAGSLTIEEKPNIAGVPTNYREAPLALRQTPILLESGSFASAKVIFEVAEIRSVKLVSPATIAPPDGTLIQRWSLAAYQAGLAPPVLRDTDEITLQTPFKVISVASAPVRYQINWEFRADMGFGAGSRCIQTRGPSVVRGATRILGIN